MLPVASLIPKMPGTWARRITVSCCISATLRLGNERWLSTTLSPEQVFPQVRAFWKDNGFNLVQDRAEAGQTQVGSALRECGLL